MSPAGIHADNRRMTARVGLFIVVAVITTLVLFSGGPNGALVFAQQTTPPPSIKWLNPDNDSSNEISAKDDTSGAPTGTSYHLVAWVASAPAGSTVTFSYAVGSGTPTTIGTATQVGTTDTYEFHWPGASMPADGPYNLIASLSPGGASPSASPSPSPTPLASDTQDVTVNNTADALPGGINPTTNQAETVEITSPANGGTLNFTDPPGAPNFTAILQVKHSSGVTTLTPYYTTSAPGTEPTWTACPAGSETPSEATNGIDCELAPNTNGAQVTGVAVVASDEPTGPATPDKDSGDAHRVTGTGTSPSPSPSTSSPSPSASSTSPSPSASSTSPSPTPSNTSASPSPTQSSPAPTQTVSPTPTGTSPPPPVFYRSTTTMNVNGNKFLGKVKSDLRKCRVRRDVVLKKERPGRDKTVGKDQTNQDGEYEIREPGADGTYYTVAKAKGFTDQSGRPVTCTKDRSPKKKV